MNPGWATSLARLTVLVAVAFRLASQAVALRIPSAVAKQIHVREGDAVTLRVSTSGLTVKPALKCLSLDDLLAQVTPENLHPATEWGADVGRWQPICKVPAAFVRDVLARTFTLFDLPTT